MPRLARPLRPLFPVIKQGVLLSTQLAAPVTRRASRLFGSAALPARAATTAEYVELAPPGGIEVIDVLPACHIERRLPVGQPPGHWTFASELRAVSPPASVTVLPGGRAAGHYGAVITADNTLLFDLSPYFGARVPSQHPIFLRAGLGAPEQIRGSVAVLTTRASDNYYHFLTDVLPRIVLLERSGIPVDLYLVNRSQPFQRDLLPRFGVPLDRVVESRLHPHIQAERLVVPALPDPNMQTPRWIVSALRERLLPAPLPPPNRKVYVGRGQKRHTRMVLNEPDVLAVLARRGVTALLPETLSVAEQIRAFAESDLVIAPHGAALTNIAFCSPGARVVELFAPSYVNVCFWALASQVEGLQYRYAIGRGRVKQPGRPMMAVSRDIEVDIDRLVAALDSFDQ